MWHSGEIVALHDAAIMDAVINSGLSSQGIRYLSCGPTRSGLTILCVHGWACRAADYSYIFSEFNRSNVSFRAISINLPGHDNSSASSYPVAGISTFATAVLDLMTELGVEDVVLVGHSMGVRVILETWHVSRRYRPPVVKGLCFIDGSHYGHRKSLFAFDSGDPRSTSLTPDQKHGKMVEAFGRFFSSNTPPEFRDAAVAHVKYIDLDYSGAMRTSFITYDHERMDDALATVGQAGVPVLSLQATSVDGQNQRIPLQARQRSRWMDLVAEKVPQARQIVVERSGHFPHVDQPAFVAAEIRAFAEVIGKSRKSMEYTPTN